MHTQYDWTIPKVFSYDMISSDITLNHNDYLSSQEEPTGEDVDGCGVDDTHPDQEGEIL